MSMQKIWNGIFTFYKPITDNVYIVSILFGISIALLLFILQKGFCCITKKKSAVSFGPVSMMVAYFIGNMTTNLPLLHPRMYRALSITSDLILKSNSYSKNFQLASGVSITGNQSVASFLYFMTEQEQQKWNCAPMSLYDSVFRTMKQIRGGGFLPNVDRPCFGCFNSALLLTIGMIVVIAIFTFVLKKRSFLERVWFLISVLFITWMTTISSGAAIASSMMWMTSAVLFFVSEMQK